MRTGTPYADVVVVLNAGIPAVVYPRVGGGGNDMLHSIYQAQYGRSMLRPSIIAIVVTHPYAGADIVSPFFNAEAQSGRESED